MGKILIILGILVILAASSFGVMGWMNSKHLEQQTAKISEQIDSLNYELAVKPTPAPPRGSILVYRRGDGGSPVSCYEGRGEECRWIPIYGTVQNIGGDGVVKVRVDVYYDTPITDSRYLQSAGTQFKETQVYLKQGEEKELEFDFWLPWTWSYSVWCP